MRIYPFIVVFCLVWFASIGQGRQPDRIYDGSMGWTGETLLKVAQDSLGYMLLQTNQSILRFNGRDFIPIPTSEGGAVRSQTDQASLPETVNAFFTNTGHGFIHQDAQGSFWVIGKDNRLYYFKTDTTQNDVQLIFEFIGMNNQKFDFPDPAITVPYEFETLSIGYVLLDYRSLGQVHYRYKIDGVHADWVDTQDPKIQFTALPNGGSYTFRVKGQYPDGDWSEEQTLQMTFLIPFYRSSWFLVALGVLGLGLFWLGIRGYFRRKLKMQQLRGELVQLESKALQSQMNPHFVFNSLNSIQSFIATGDSLRSEVYLSKFSNLLRKILENSRKGTVSLVEEIEHIQRYLELEKMRFQDRLEYKISVDPDVEQDMIQVPPLILQPFVENAIVHGLGPKPEGGTVSLTIQMASQTQLRCQISDDGVGRGPQTRKEHNSLGTTLVGRRLALLDGNDSQRIHYKDLTNAQGEPCGTIVELIIPV